jgi:hypothetical protein
MRVAHADIDAISSRAESALGVTPPLRVVTLRR